MLQKREHGFRLARLFSDFIALRGQPGLKTRQFGITLSLIEGPRAGKGDFPARSFRQFVEDTPISAGEEPRLECGCLKLNKHAEEKEQYQAKAQQADLQPPFYCWGKESRCEGGGPR